MSATQKTRVVGYCRVSTAEQALDGVSLDAQSAKLKAYAVATDLNLVAVRVDAGASAKTLARPGLQQALADMREGRADGVLVMKLDRLTRSVADLGVLLEQYFGDGFTLISVSDTIDTRTAAGRLMLNILTSVAQWERETVVERTKTAMCHLQSEGVTVGRAAMGWHYGEDADRHGRRVIIEDASELETKLRILDLREQGHTYWSICEKLTTEGRRTKRGGQWRPATVRKILLRETA